MWTELFFLNRDPLLTEMDQLISNISQARDALAAGDRALLEEVLRQGREAKEHIDALNPDQPSE